MANRKDAGGNDGRRAVLALVNLWNAWAKWSFIETWMKERRNCEKRHERNLEQLQKAVNTGIGCAPGERPVQLFLDTVTHGPALKLHDEFLDHVETIAPGIASAAAEVVECVSAGALDALNEPGSVKETRAVLVRLTETIRNADALDSFVKMERLNGGKIGMVLDPLVASLAADHEYYIKLDDQFQSAIRLPAPKQAKARAMTAGAIHKAFLEIDKRNKLLRGCVEANLTVSQMHVKMKKAGFKCSRPTVARWAKPFRESRDKRPVSFGETDPEKTVYGKTRKKQRG